MATEPRPHQKEIHMKGQCGGDGPRSDVSGIARLLGLDIVEYVVNEKQPFVSTLLRPPALRTAKTLRRTVDEISQRHEILFRGMVKKLNIRLENMEQVFVNIADEIFKDKQYNWGRVVSVYAFGARLAKYAADNHLTNNLHFVGHFVGEYVAQNLAWWIEKKGGWCAFQEYFPERVETRMEDNLWKGLLATAGVGLAALAAVVVVR